MPATKRRASSGHAQERVRARSGLSSPCHSAEFLGGVHEQRLNLIGAAALDSAEVAARRVGLIYPDILAAEHIDRIFGPHGALAFAHLREPEIGMGMVRRSGVIPARDGDRYEKK